MDIRFIVQVAASLKVLLALLITLSGCANVPLSAQSQVASSPATVPRPYVHPDDYRYSPVPQIIYRARPQFSPPEPWYLGKKDSRPMAEIFASDDWVVTHKVDDKFLAFSEAFQIRQERLKGKFDRPYKFHIVIDAVGTVSGWKKLLDPKIVTLKTERMTIMNPKFLEGGDWSNVPAFELVHGINGVRTDVSPSSNKQ
jgi:hypothetical protein